MNILLAAALCAVQPRHDFGPALASVEEVCQAFLPPGEKLELSEKAGDRYVVVHLKNRSWSEVQSCLRQGLGLEATRTSAGWRIDTAPEVKADWQRKQEAIRSILKQEIVDRANQVLADHQHLRPKSSDYSMQEVREAAKKAGPNFIWQDYLIFGDLYFGAMIKNYVRHPSRDDKWTAILGAAKSGEAAIDTGMMQSLEDSDESLYKSFNWEDRERPADHPTRLNTLFNWHTFSLVSFFESEDTNSVSAMGSASQGEFDSDLANLRIRSLLGIDRALTLAQLADSEAAHIRLDASNPGDSRLAPDLLAFARQTKTELLAEVHPFGEASYIPSQLRVDNITLYQRFYEWTQTSHTFDALTDSLWDGLLHIPNPRIFKTDDPIKDNKLDSAYFLYANELFYRQYAEQLLIFKLPEISIKDNVLLFSLKGAPCADMFKIPAPEYWTYLHHPTLLNLRRYWRDTSVERNQLWASFVAGNGSLFSFTATVKAHPYMHAIESDAEAVRQLDTAGKASIHLSPSEADRVLKQAASLGDYVSPGKPKAAAAAQGMTITATAHDSSISLVITHNGWTRELKIHQPR